MGRKYIIELEDKNVWECGYPDRTLSLDMTVLGKALTNVNTGIPLTPYTEPDMEQVRKRGYDKGLDDIGNALRLLLFQYSNYTLQEIFGYDTARAVVEHFEGSEIVARIRCYEGGVKQDVETIRKEAYQKGLSDAWEAARKTASDNAGRNYSIFGQHFTIEILNTHSASEALEEIRAYEQAQKEKEESEKGQSVTAEEVMRQYLDKFCRGHFCSTCPLHTSEFTCGRGYHFATKNPISNEEVRRAYAKVLQHEEVG